MTGLIVAVSILGTVLVSVIVVGTIKFYKTDKTLNNLAQCFLEYVTNPESVDIVQDYPAPKSKKSGKDFGFPNSEGF